MSDTKASGGRVLRFIASGGMADEDQDVAAELRRTAEAFLEQLGSDTFGEH